MPAATLRTSWRWLADPYGTLDTESARRGPTFWLRLALVGRALVTGDPALVREITAHPDLESGSGISALRKVFGDGSLITLDGAAHAERRRLVAPFFRQGLGALDDATCAATAEALHGAATFSVYDLARRVSLCAIVRFLLNLPPAEAAHAEQLVDAFLLSFESPWVLFLRPLHIDLGRFTPWGRAVRNRERLRSFLREHVRTARTGVEGGGVLGTIARAAPDLPEDAIVAEALALLLFGHDTGAAALAWAVAHIWRQPEILARVHAEADAAHKKDGRPVPESHPYLEACLKESLRLTPVVVHLTRVAARETRIGGHTVPAGARVFPCSYLAHRDPAVFPEPTAFRPERFLHGETYDGSWFPFGVGARTCIGNRFALRQMLLTAATLARTPGLTLAPGWQPRPVRRLVLVLPDGGTRMCLEAPR